MLASLRFVGAAIFGALLRLWLRYQCDSEEHARPPTPPRGRGKRWLGSCWELLWLSTPPGVCRVLLSAAPLARGLSMTLQRLSDNTTPTRCGRTQRHKQEPYSQDVREDL